ncbi:hypothetical protein CASFOL_016159 [Castilleja foliolosa]|uniref:Uncharacterized protein n=1 Tax=Castilleja foliolosa TaxID=1961234 RepID=A0ABD3DHT3_9LAMI
MLPEIQNADGIVDVLMEMLAALEPNNPQILLKCSFFAAFEGDVKDEIIVDLVDQCRSYQTRVTILVNNTVGSFIQGIGVEMITCSELFVSMTLLPREQHKLVMQLPETPVAPLMNVNHEDGEPEDDFAQLARRINKGDTTQGSGGKTAAVKTGPVHILPPPPSSNKPTNSDSNSVDYLRGDLYETEQISGPTTHSAHQKSIPPQSPTLSSSLPDDFVNPTAAMFAPKPTYHENAPTSKSVDQLLSSPWDAPPTAHIIPPPPARYNQRQQFFEQDQGGPSRSSSESGSSYDSLVGQTQNLSVKPPAPSKPEKSEDALFRDLVDFAKAKSSSPKPDRSFN